MISRRIIMKITEVSSKVLKTLVMSGLYNGDRVVLQNPSVNNDEPTYSQFTTAEIAGEFSRRDVFGKAEYHVSNLSEAESILFLMENGYIVYRKNGGLAVVTPEIKKAVDDYIYQSFL